MDEERRAALRRRVLWQGKLTDTRGAGVLDCRVRNISPNGALVETASGAPQLFSRLLTMDGVDTGYRVVWTQGRRSGLRFDPANAEAPQ